MPPTVAMFGTYAFLFFARSRRSVIGGTVLQIILFCISYWSEGFIAGAINQAYGYD